MHVWVAVELSSQLLSHTASLQTQDPKESTAPSSSCASKTPPCRLLTTPPQIGDLLKKQDLSRYVL